MLIYIFTNKLKTEREEVLKQIKASSNNEIKYFNVAINDIRNKEVSDERKASRAKRLLLSPKFNKWIALMLFIDNINNKFNKFYLMFSSFCC